MKDRKPSFYASQEEMQKPLSELMEELRRDVANVRGKLYDIKQTYGWADRIEFIEGGLTCMLVSMHSTLEEWKNFENRKKLTQ